MPSKPLVSILIPTYNQAAVLARAVQSAIDQTYEPKEIVICDDASPDSTIQVAQNFSHLKNVRYHRNPKNLGRVGNYRNSIYTLAKGEWCLNVDGDDYLCNPDYLAHAMSLALSDSEIRLVFGRQKYRDEFSGKEWNQRPLDLPPISSGTDYLLKCGSITDGVPNISALFHRQHAIDRGVQQVDCIASDSESLFRIMAGVKIGFLNEIAGVWNMSPSNASGTINVNARVHHFDMIFKPAQLFKEKNLLSENETQKFVTGLIPRVLKDDIYLFLENRDFKGMKEYYAKTKSFVPIRNWCQFLLDPRFWIKLIFPGILDKLFQKYRRQKT